MISRRAQPALLIALAVLPHLGVLWSEFVQDDVPIVVENPVVNGERSPWAAFATGYWAHRAEHNAGNYRPFAVLFLAAEYRLWGEHPAGYHAVNLALHALVTLCLWGFLRRMGIADRIALAATALFAVHPVHVEAISLVVGVLELLSALGILVWASLHAGDYRLGLWPRSGVCLLAALAGAGALLSKESAVVLPGLLVLIDLCRSARPRFTPLRLGMTAVSILLVGGLMVLRWLVLGLLIRPPIHPDFFIINPLAFLSPLARIGVALRVIGYELWILVIPWRLSIDHSYNTFALSPAWLQPGTIASVAAIIALAGWAVWAWRRGDTPISLAVGWFAVSLFPTSNLLAIIGTTMAERLLYVPSMGFCLGLALALHGAAIGIAARSKAQGAFIAACGVLCTLYAVRAVFRVHDFRSDRAVYEAAAQVNPDSAFIELNLAMLAESAGERDVARRHYQRALEIRADFPMLLLRWGNFLRSQGAPREALRALQRVTQIDPKFQAAWVLQANLALDLGRPDLAVEALNRALALRPEDPLAWIALGDARRMGGDLTTALTAYRRGAALAPQLALPLNQIGDTLLALNRPRDALVVLGRAVAVEPAFAQAHVTLARALLRLGRSEEARGQLDEALRLDPANAEAREMLRR
jgi:tetratricopeptide (TPR) repeat protein